MAVFKLDKLKHSQKNMKIKTTHRQPGFIGACDPHRKQRLIELSGLLSANHHRILELNWPGYHEQERALDTSDLPLGGPQTILPLAQSLAEHSQLIRAGVPVIPSPEFQDVDLPVIDRSLQATWGGSSVDIGDGGIFAALPTPKRLSAYVIVSRQLRLQNPLFAGAFLENQLLAAMGRALDHAAIVGDGTGENPIGILNDGEVLTRDRATAGTDTLADLAGMQKTIADANGEADDEGYFWISSTDVREALQTTEGIGAPIWTGPGPMGQTGIASVHPPAETLILAQPEAMAFVDWQRLQIENVLDAQQAKSGFLTLIVTGYYDVAITDPSGICRATDPA